MRSGLRSCIWPPAAWRETRSGSNPRDRRHSRVGLGLGSRFTDRFQAAAREISTALIELSLVSPVLQDAARQVNDALAAIMKAGKQPDADAADKQTTKAKAHSRQGVARQRPGLLHQRRHTARRGQRPPLAPPHHQRSGTRHQLDSKRTTTLVRLDHERQRVGVPEVCMAWELRRCAWVGGKT